MSVFTNPGAAAAKENELYVSSILELLGDSDPIEVLSQLPGLIAHIVAGLSDEALRRPEEPGKWSMVEVIQHLADSDLVWAYRLRMVLAHEEPELGGYNQDLWANRLGYADVSVADAIEQLTVLRSANLRLLRTVPPAALLRAGIHLERGRETLDHMLRLYAGHDLVHVRQLERIKEVTGESVNQ